jgi:adenylate cyclase
MSKRQRRANLTGFLIGLAATAAATIGYLAGWLGWVELKTLDLRFLYANSIPEDPRIVCVDIDDGSLRKVGRWPWPRDEQAALIAVLAEAGARTILVDLTFPEAEPVRTWVPPNVDLLADPLSLTCENLELLFPDDELRAAITTAGNVYLAAYYDRDAWDRSRAFRDAVEALRAGTGPRPSAPARATQQRRSEGSTTQIKVGARRRPIADAARVALALESDPLLDDRTIAERSGLDPAFVQEVFERCRQFVLRNYVRGHLAAHPEWRGAPPRHAVPTLYRELTTRPMEGETPLGNALLAAFADALSYEATAPPNPAWSDRIRAAAVAADAIVPAYFPLAQAARGCGFVSFETEKGDGVMRRCALFALHDERPLLQLAFAVACDALKITPADVSVRGNDVLLAPRGSDRAPLDIQLDERHQVLLPWVPRAAWIAQFGPHVPADVLWTVHDRRRQIAHNERLLRENLAGDLFGDATRLFRQKLAELAEAEQAYRAARSRGNTDEANRKAEVARLEQQAAELQRAALENLRAERQRLTTQPAADSFFVQQLAALNDVAAQVIAANAKLQAEIDETLAWLRARVQNKICLIGYTATSLADMTPIPTHPRAPGIMAHANLLNGLLTGRMVRWATAPLNAALAVLCGLAVSLVSIWRGPRLAGLVVAALCIMVVGGGGAWVFYRWTYWVALTPPVAAMLISYFGIAMYRYVFMDRERRQLTTALSQYTSATLARKMAEDAELCRRAETREVSAMFTDLRGFTTISERIGAERTQRVLNALLGRCSEVMLRHEAMINKFIGDGIFAFWNPVIYPQPDHALRACETAVDLQTAVRELADEQRRGHGDEVFSELVLRVGVASGPAVVGPCGSEQKYDYTCIGDTVNLASRLESANKFYGTRVLIGEATRAAAGERFVVRPLGGVQVKGRRQPVPIYELLGRTGEVADELREYATDFGQAVVLFQQRQWPAARAAFEACRQRRADDLAAERYLEAIAGFGAHPPPDDWSAALELTEK